MDTITIEGFLMSLDKQAREHVEGTAQAVGVSSEKLNLDSQGRAGSKLIVGDDYVACFGSELSSMNYYGGMEYHPEDYVHRMGDLIIFSVSGEDECRVKESLLHWEEEGRAEHENEKEKGNSNVKNEYNYSPIEIYDTSERVEGSRFDELMESEGMTYCKEKCAYWGDDPRGAEYGTVWVACPHGDEEQTLLPTFLRIEWVGEHDHWAHELKTDYFASWAGTHVQSRRILNSSGKRLN